MSELDEIKRKLKVILNAGDIMLNPPDDLAWLTDKDVIKQSRIDQILSLETPTLRIAVVKRVPELPKIGEKPTAHYADRAKGDWEGYIRCQQAMLSAGFVQEVKDE